MKPRIIYTLLIGLVLLPAFSWAQIDRTELNGTVTDPSGATVTKAAVTVIQEGTNQVRTVTTDGHGQFVVSSLPIGRFAVVFLTRRF